MKNLTIPKRFKLDDNAEACVTYVHSVTGSQKISVDSPWEDLTPNKARKFAAWLIKAAEYIEESRKK